MNASENWAFDDILTLIFFVFFIIVISISFVLRERFTRLGGLQEFMVLLFFLLLILSIFFGHVDFERG